MYPFHWATATSPNSVVTHASRSQPTPCSCNRWIEATLYRSISWLVDPDRTRARSAVILAGRPNDVVHAPMAPRINHLPPQNQRFKLKIDSGMRHQTRCALDEGMGVVFIASLLASVVRSKTKFNLGVTTLIERNHHTIPHDS